MDEKQQFNYSANSYTSREKKNRDDDTEVAQKEKRIERVVNGNVKVKKKSVFSKIRDSIVSDDSTSVKSYILNDVLIPSFKKAVSDIVTNGIDIILYGETRHSKKPNGSKVSYTSYYDRDRDDRYRAPITRSDYSYNNVVVSSRAEAEKIIEVLEETISTYGVATVADFYDSVGITGQFTDNNFGWTNLSTAKAIPTRDGWIISLPRALAITN